MMTIRIAYSILAILCGAFLIGFGGYDDSPGAQGLGVLVVIFGVVMILKNMKKKFAKPL